MYNNSETLGVTMVFKANKKVETDEVYFSNEDNYKLKYFNTLMENSIVSKSDLEGNITFVNPQFEEALGYTKEEVLGKNHSVLRNPNTPNSVFKALWGTIQAKNVFKGNVLSKRKDGSDFWAETTIIPLLDENDENIVEYIAIRTDITEFLSMKRDREQQKIKLREQQKIDQAKDSFLLLFTHELKTPLNAIINFSKYLQKSTGNNISPDKKIKLLSQIELSAIKMLHDITQLLLLGKVKANKLSYKKVNFDANKIINDLAKENIDKKKEHNITVEILTCKENCIIHNDQHRFQQIVKNLIEDSIKFASTMVIIETKIEDGNYIVTIEDNGKSIEKKDNIFELYIQEIDGYDEQRGTGVELNLTKNLAKNLDIELMADDSTKLSGLKYTIKTPIV